MRNHQGYNAQVMQLITGEYSSIDSKNCIYGPGKNEKRKRLNASIKTQQRPRNKAGRRIRAQGNRNNKEKRSALLSLHAKTMVKRQKSQKQSLRKRLPFKRG